MDIFIQVTILVMVSLVVTECSPLSCNLAYDQAATNFYSEGKKSRYTYNDFLYIQHGKMCDVKCNSIANYYDLFGFRSCTKGTCPIVEPDVTKSIPINQCSRIDNSNVHCDPLHPYRTMDGQCNNLMFPNWGKDETPQPRLLANAYDDGQGVLKTKGCNGPLLNERAVSNIVHKAGAIMKIDPKASLMLTLMGQILAHDSMLTKMETDSNGNSLECCGKNKEDAGCDPITVPLDDPHFTPGQCLSFSRSKAQIDCNGIRQQLNSQTSPFDLSMVYGPNDKKAAEGRAFEGGKLKTVDNKLPVDTDDNSCELSKPINVPHYYCTSAGDPRANENPALSSFHTILLREHNRLAELLAIVNPHWDDEKLYQEARKINIAQWQNIIYQEYLPLLINPYTMRKFNLKIRRSGYNDRYNPNVDVSVINEFAAAAFRFGHSMVHRNISMLGYSQQFIRKDERLDDHFFEPWMYHANKNRGLEYIMMWTANTRCPRFDTELEPSVQTFLMKDEDLKSTDLAMLNVKRGRDHGLPGYNAYRQLCGLSRIQHFGTYAGGLVHHHPGVAVLLQQAYSCPDDIDLFTGMLSERPMKGAILGPTAACIHAIQFKRLKDGDRFFFERRDPVVGFTRAQLDSIKKVKFSTLMCLNTPAERLQRNVFKLPTNHQNWHKRRGNALSSCSKIRECKVDLNLWREIV